MPTQLLNSCFDEGIKDSEERNAYILMDRIKPTIPTNYMVRPGQKAKLVDVISELGVFGYVIGYVARYQIKEEDDHGVYLQG